LKRTDRIGASQVVLILAPLGRDVNLSASVLRRAKIIPKSCQSFSELSERLRGEGNSVGALLLTEESLASPVDCSSLTEWLEHQEPWSDLPIVLLSRPGSADEGHSAALGRSWPSCGSNCIKNVYPDVLICYLAMPEMDGYELLENVRGLEPELGRLPVIAFTAAARDEDRARTQKAGFQAHLAKPVDPNKLITTILELATAHAGQRLLAELRRSRA
jgi:CheY-like chemotaxis protein